MAEPDLFEQARIFLPKYLSPEKTRDLYEGLKGFPEHFNYYTTDPALAAELLQGDGWRGFVVIEFHTLEKKTVPGLVMSNSCDVDSKNPRPLPPNVLFAPLIPLSRYARRLSQAGQQEGQIGSMFDSIRKQKTTSVFYLPAIPDVMEESIAILGDVHPHPLDDFLRSSARAPIFTLSQMAFYLLLIKISIHFTRMQEEVSR